MATCSIYRAVPRTKPSIGTSPSSWSTLCPCRSASTSSFMRMLGGTLFMALISSGSAPTEPPGLGSPGGYQRLFAFTGNLALHRLRPEQTNIFFKLIEERYRRRPTLITSNIDYPEWQAVLGNKTLTEALLSRLRHQCHTIRIDGPPLR